MFTFDFVWIYLCFFCCASTLLQCLVFYASTFYLLQCSWGVLRSAAFLCTFTCCILHQKMKLFFFLFDGSLTHKYTGLDGRKSYFAMCACTAADAKFRELRFTKPSAQGQNACSAWALSDDSKFQADERRCTYTSRVAVCCACTQFEVDWRLEWRSSQSRLYEISLVQRGRARPKPHIHKSIRIFLFHFGQLWRLRRRRLRRPR